ncbi:hypothetical protein CH262_03150 [Rhodococcus sp. 05-2255-1e]|nr:hypothetical protein CHX23_24055 [Rhodococcus fascians]OZE28330.1 hypothetical protein CH262_03150 [Rhodococcus sp. 05-2255-1e]
MSLSGLCFGHEVGEVDKALWWRFHLEVVVEGVVSAEARRASTSAAREARLSIAATMRHCAMNR